MLQTQDSPDEQLTRLEQRELIRRTMETLPQKDRDIARAFYLEGASYNELTSTHGLSYKAISFRLSRAKQQLSKRLRYLLTGVFVSLGLTLKKPYTGGLTAMKVGTPPKMTVGTTGLIALIIIGFIGLRWMNEPIVEERVYLSPWEDGTPRPRYTPGGLSTGTTQNTESRNNLPQIATTASIAGTEPVNDFFGQPDETDMSQFTTEMEFELDTMEGFTTDVSASSESIGQFAEDVMYAYLEAYRNSDFKAMRPLMAEMGHEDPGDGGSINMSDEAPDEVVETSHQLEPMLVEAIREIQRQTSIVSSEYVGDEFHFRLRTPGSELPGISDQGTPMFTFTIYLQVKMRKENGVWRVYNTMFDLDRAMSEMRVANMRSDMGRSNHDDSEISIEIREVQHESSDGIQDEIINTSHQFEPMLVESFRQMRRQSSVIDGEYVGDEFHFQLRMPAPKGPDGGEKGIEMPVTSPTRYCYQDAKREVGVASV